MTAIPTNKPVNLSAVVPQLVKRNIGQDTSVSSNNNEPKQEARTTIDEADENFKKVKLQYTKILGGITGVSALGIILGSLKYGLTFSSKCLQVLGDVFGSIASVAGPFALIKNEIDNYNLLHGIKKQKKQIENGSNQNQDDNLHFFNNIREVFYRCCSLGFTPFIFEPFLNPEKFGKSVFHKIATVASIPNLAFALYAWGFGNFQAILSWGLRQGEKVRFNNTKNKNHDIKAKAYDRIYLSAKRLAILGSITNPILQNVRQWADTCALFTKEISFREFFQRPILGFSRLVSFFTGIPELFAKSVDSVVRVFGERKHLRPVLPETWNKKIDEWGTKLENNLGNEKKTKFKAVRHFAEIIFHTLSPMSMFSLFAPMLDEPITSESAQERGGSAKVIDTTIGGIGKALSFVFTGVYITFARFPQFLIQSVFYGKKYLTGKNPTPEDLRKSLNSIANWGPIKNISKWAHDAVEKLVPGYYEQEHDHKYLSFEEGAACDAFDQVKEEFKQDLVAGTQLSSEKQQEILDYALKNYLKKEALQDYHILTESETTKIEDLINKKIQNAVEPNQNGNGFHNKPKPIKPGAYFLATYIFRLLDIKSRIENTDCLSNYRNMKTVYRREEIDLSFDGEQNPVYTECIQGLRRTVDKAREAYYALAG